MLITELPKYTQDVLQEELTVTARQIGDNMFRNKQVVSGRTRASLRVEAQPYSGAIYGAEHIDTLEKGISPERSRMRSLGHVRSKLAIWVQMKGGFSFNRGINEQQWAYLAARKQQIVGSVLYRLGGRTDVYSSEVQPLLKRIGDKIAEGFVTVKIIE